MEFIQSIGFFLLFCVSIFFGAYIPGSLLVHTVKLRFIEKATLAVSLGLVLLSWQGMLLGYLQLRFLSSILIFICTAAFFHLWKQQRFHISFPKIHPSSWYFFLIIMLGVLSQLPTILFAGSTIDNTIFYCCGYTKDNILHLSYIQSILNSFPPLEPGLTNTIIKNYHYLSHISIAELIRIFHLPLVQTTMQCMPLLLCLLLGGNAITFSRLLKLSHTYTAWLLFFLYFGGDFIYLLSFVLTGKAVLQAMPLTSGAHFLVNYPMAFGTIVALAAINLFIIFLQQKKSYLAYLTGFLIGSVVGYKVNVAPAVFAGLGMVTAFSLLKKQVTLLVASALALTLSLIVYLPVISVSGGFFFTGFWRAENFMSQSMFADTHLVLAKQVYETHHNTLRIIQYNLMFSVFFFFGIFGTKLLALFQTRNSLRYFPTQLHIFLLSGIIIGIILGFFFIQIPGGANSIFFLMTSYTFISFYTALACSYWTQKLEKPFSLLFIILIVGLTLPAPIFETFSNLKQIVHLQGFHISSAEQEALTYLRERTPADSIILVDPTNPMNYDAPYVYLYTNRAMFLSGRGNELGAHSIDFKKQDEAVSIIFTSNDQTLVQKTLQENNISYIYLFQNRHIPSLETNPILQKAFNNSQVKIYKVN